MGLRDTAGDDDILTLSGLVKVNKVVDTARRDVTEQKPFTASPFTGQSSLTSFIDDLQTEKNAR